MHKLSEETESRFEREGKLLSELTHLNIVRFVASGETDSGAPFLAMEWIEGEDLAKRLERGPLSIDESLRLARKLADALTEAHGRGITHRDIKPSNVLLEGRAVDVFALPTSALPLSRIRR